MIEGFLGVGRYSLSVLDFEVLEAALFESRDLDGARREVLMNRQHLLVRFALLEICTKIDVVVLTKHPVTQLMEKNLLGFGVVLIFE